MTDDLVKRLREDQPVTQDMVSTMQCALQDAAADRIEELEANLAKATEALVRIADTPSEMTWGVDSEVREAMNKMEIIAETTLAELTSSEAANGEAKGGNDE